MSLFNNKLQKVQLSMLDTDVQTKFTGYDTSLAQIASQKINVKAFGAKGDTIINPDNSVASGTDDTASIQNALNSVPTSPNSKGGYVLYFPPGVYLISASLVIPANVRVTFRGTGVGGSNATIIKCANPNVDMIDADTHILDTFSMEYIQLQHAGQVAGTGRGLVLGGTSVVAWDSRIQNNWFTAMPTTAIYANNMQGYHISNNGIELGQYGIYVVKGLDNVITNNRFYGLTKSAIYIADGTGGNNSNTINSNHFDLNGTAGDDTTGAIVISNSGLTEHRNNLIATNNFKSNQQDILLTGSGGLSAHTGISNTSIIGNASDFPQRRSINVKGANGTKILSNTINDGNQAGASLPAIDIQGTSDKTVVDGNASSFIVNGIYQQTYGLQLGATTTNTSIGDNQLKGNSGEINIITGATLMSMAAGTGWQSYTPVLYGDTTAGSNTYSAQTGYWRQFGSEVTVYLVVGLSAKDGTMANGMRISLPVAATSRGNAFGDFHATDVENITFSAGQSLNGYIGSNSNFVVLINNASGASLSLLTASQITNTSKIIAKVTYMV